MAQRISRKELKHDEFVETAADFGQWVEENWKTVAKVAAGIVLAVVVALGWAANRRSGIEAGKTLLARAVIMYEEVEAEGFAKKDKLPPVLEALDKAISRAGNSTPGNVARFYRGSLMLHMNRNPEAIQELEKVIERSEGTLAVTARHQLAEAYLAHGKADDAVTLLETMLDEPADPLVPEDQTLLLLARVYEESGRADDARRQWQRIVDDFPTSAAAVEARRLLEG